MHSIQLKNFRSLEDTGMIELKPITILLGQNSSGKSSFLRALPLLRQTSEARTRGPLLWFGRLVDFGDFQKTLMSNASPAEITLGFKLLPGLDAEAVISAAAYQSHRYHYYWRPHKLEQESWPTEVTFTIADGGPNGIPFTRIMTATLADHVVEIEASESNHLKSIKINGREFSQFFHVDMPMSWGSLVPSVQLQLEDDSSSGDDTVAQTKRRRVPSILIKEFVQKLRQKAIHGRMTDNKVFEIASSFMPGTCSNILRQVKTKGAAGTFWASHVKEWTEQNPDFQYVRDYIIALHINALLSVVSDSITTMCNGIRYIEPLRATANRYYRFQDLAIDEIDAHGQNLPMFINSLSVSQRAAFEEWMTSYFGFSVKPDRQTGHISLQVCESGQKLHNLADSGFGYSQILPIATQLWWQVKSELGDNRHHAGMTDKGFLVVEQPELHLHPKMQAQVADAFAAAVNTAKNQQFRFRILAETHSEAIVNRIGELIGSGTLKREDVNIVLFERDSPDSPCKVRSVSYDEKGYLQDWPCGFFNASRN